MFNDIRILKFRSKEHEDDIRCLRNEIADLRYCLSVLASNLGYEVVATYKPLTAWTIKKKENKD